MRKVALSVIAAGALLFSGVSTNGQAVSANSHVNSTESISQESIQKVSTSKATAKTGTFKMKHNTNVRRDAGTKNGIIITAKKGAVAKATHQKKVGKETWYKVNVNGKSGWVLSTLLTPQSTKAVAKKAPAKKAPPKKAAPKATAASGTYKTKYNSNVRANAGTNHKIVTLAKKGTTVKVTSQKKVGKTTWYRVSANGKTGWVSGDLLTKTTAKATAKKAPAKKATVKKASNSVASSSLINNAKALLGTPYRFGGTTKSGFDCSGFTQYAFKQSGKNISRTTLGQFAETQKVSNPQPGDLVFFAGTYRSGISHVGIYLGNNQFIHAAGKNVRINNVNEAYWKNHFHSYRR